MKMEIEIIARAVILNRGRILLCRIRGSSWYFLPGGHVESQEKITQALRRELKEELRANMGILKFIGAVENFYVDRKRRRHEINLVFQSKLVARDHNNSSAEDHIQFNWINTELIPKTKILPVSMKKNLLRWLKDKKTIWGS